MGPTKGGATVLPAPTQSPPVPSITLIDSSLFPQCIVTSNKHISSLNEATFIPFSAYSWKYTYVAYSVKMAMKYQMLQDKKKTWFASQKLLQAL